MEKIFSFAWRGKRGLENVEETGDSENDHLVDDEQGLQVNCFLSRIESLQLCTQFSSASTRLTQLYKFTSSERKETKVEKILKTLAKTLIVLF